MVASPTATPSPEIVTYHHAVPNPAKHGATAKGIAGSFQELTVEGISGWNTAARVISTRSRGPVRSIDGTAVRR